MPTQQPAAPGRSRLVRHLAAAALVAATQACFFAAAARADLVRILHENRDAVQARIDLVQQARHEINAAYYIVGDDEVPLVFLSLLRDAARRGLAVRLIVDGHSNNNQMPRALEAHLIRAGVEIREFHPKTPGHRDWAKHRMHDKLLVVDGEQMITGGRNIKNEYFGLDCRNYVDRDVYLRGCKAAEARSYFMSLWSSEDVLPARLVGPMDEKIPQTQRHCDLNDACDEDAIRRAGLLLDEAPARAVACNIVRLDTGRDWSAAARQVESICFLHDYPCIDKQEAGIGRDMIGLLSTARCSLVLETPYLALSREMKRLLTGLSRQGVHVTILTNSFETNDEKPAQALYENDKRQFLRAGIELWELRGCDHLHAKAAVIDGCVAVIGSYNFDELSQKKNSEVALAVYDARTAAELFASFSTHLQRAYQIGRNLRPVGYDAKYPGADRQQIRELRRNRVVVPLIKRFL
jgi:phosphatidylserine/phosphatidylglycerophosphate/cardiolipin synthase-like enzyme